nr:immunoglobulin heavy chain junction region [Macaca mulatta]MOV39173.1 immunoglobulin heavy chain junction region [Macaca mulatta]MOV40079.1 immunoglobulin heavy chain junction region [Macaca mulatta]MOV40115.1 immunoglobulin heavy chain junction region [Macaca mulatta]MOV40219.1 immunoglobulin heavy chain junction region [Macaca mulatta]
CARDEHSGYSFDFW